jgi:hypothetical protein
MEVSGTEIMSPERAAATLASETLILVCNPNHLAPVRDWVAGAWEVILPLDLGHAHEAGPAS